MKITITRGLPGCGKSTWAHEQVRNDIKNTVVLSADSVRKMCFDSFWQRDRSNRNITESFVSKCIMNLAILGLDEHKHVIIDETNLSSRSLNKWDNLAKTYNIELNIQDFTDVPLDVCLDRDAARDRSVGESVIKQKYRQFIKPKNEQPPLPTNLVTPPQYLPDKPDVAMFDMDGSLSLIEGRSPYDVSKCINDPPHKPVVDLLHTITDGCDTGIIIMSGRDEGLARENTVRWLSNNGIIYNELIMRPAGDTRRDDIVKLELYEKYVKGNYNVLWVIDDRNRVVDMWRSIGLTCLQCNDGDF